MSVDQARSKLTNIVLGYLEAEPGLTDRQLADRVFGKAAHPSQVNQSCRLLASQGLLERKAREDGRIGNYLCSDDVDLGARATLPAIPPLPNLTDRLGEDEVKNHLMRWLQGSGWSVEVAWGRARGIDIVALRDDTKWIIEAKGCGSLQAMRVNYFLAILGETLQRMSDPLARYSIALPAIPQFRRLWDRLPVLAKQRTAISALFVTPDGSIDEIAS